MRDFVAWLSETPLSIALRESFVLWPALEAAHVMSIMLFAGTIFMVDLRLLGIVFKKVPFSEMDKRILPLTVAGFILLVITGVILVYSKPLVYYYSAFFRFKMVVIVIAMANIGVFHKMVQKGQAAWDTDEKAPRAGQISAIISLASWIVVIILGRMIAYDWLQCEKLEPGSFMHTFTHCKPMEVAGLDLDLELNLGEIS